MRGQPGTLKWIHFSPPAMARSVDIRSELHAGLADGSYEARLRRW